MGELGVRLIHLALDLVPHVQLAAGFILHFDERDSIVADQLVVIDREAGSWVGQVALRFFDGRRFPARLRPIGIARMPRPPHVGDCRRRRRSERRHLER